MIEKSSSISSSNHNEEFYEDYRNSEENKNKKNFSKINEKLNFENIDKKIFEKNEQFFCENNFEKNGDYLKRETFKEQLGNFIQNGRKKKTDKKTFFQNQIFFEDFKGKNKFSIQNIRTSKLIEECDFKK